MFISNLTVYRFSTRFRNVFPLETFVFHAYKIKACYLFCDIQVSCNELHWTFAIGCQISCAKHNIDNIQTSVECPQLEEFLKDVFRDCMKVPYVGLLYNNWGCWAMSYWHSGKWWTSLVLWRRIWSKVFTCANSTTDVTHFCSKGFNLHTCYDICLFKLNM